MKLFGNSPEKSGRLSGLLEGLKRDREDREGDELDTEYEDAPEDDEKALTSGPLQTGLIISISALLTILVIVGAMALMVNHYLNLINYQAANSDYFVTVSSPEELPEETPVSEKLAVLDKQETAESLEATPEELAQWDAHIENVISDGETYEVPISEDVYNILLIGSDTRVTGEVGRSDAMILLSINQRTETIYLTSFLRDCYVYIPGYGNTRLNHAFAYGGPDLLEQTLEENFKVHVDRYAMVDFFSFMAVIDILGGVWIDVSEDERLITDEYIWSMNKLMDEEWSKDYLWSSGWQKLNGKQALCYARNRYTGNDFDRTQRQRNIISQIITGAKGATPAQLVELAQVILPQITTDLSKTQILSYAANAGAYMNYEMVSQQIPVAGTYSGATISGMSVISMDLDANISYLQGTVYAGTEYNFETPEIQTSEDFELPDDYDPAVFWGREEWSDIVWEWVNWDKLDCWHIDFDTVNWEDYYYTDEEYAALEEAGALPTPYVLPSSSATPKPSATRKPTATPKPTSKPTAKPSATPKPIAAPTATPAIEAPSPTADDDE